MVIKDKEHKIPSSAAAGCPDQLAVDAIISVQIRGCS